ncbi:hypothetical protein B224_0841 [Aeromonas media WS]|nr:hypothetical protein B224_0841 [Aeromonas media WS]
MPSIYIALNFLLLRPWQQARHTSITHRQYMDASAFLSAGVRIV